MAKAGFNEAESERDLSDDIQYMEEWSSTYQYLTQELSSEEEEAIKLYKHLQALSLNEFVSYLRSKKEEGIIHTGSIIRKVIAFYPNSPISDFARRCCAKSVIKLVTGINLFKVNMELND